MSRVALRFGQSARSMLYRSMRDPLYALMQGTFLTAWFCLIETPIGKPPPTFRRRKVIAERRLIKA